MRDGRREPVRSATRRRVHEADVPRDDVGRLRPQRRDVPLDAGLERGRVEEAADALAELAEHLRLVRLGVVLLQLREIVDRERRVEERCRRLHYERRRAVARPVLLVQVIQGTAVPVGRGEDDHLAPGRHHARPERAQHLQVGRVALGRDEERQLVGDRRDRRQPAHGRRAARVGGDPHAVPQRQHVRLVSLDHLAERAAGLERRFGVVEQRARRRPEVLRDHDGVGVAEPGQHARQRVGRGVRGDRGRDAGLARAGAGDDDDLAPPARGRVVCAAAGHLPEEPDAGLVEGQPVDRRQHHAPPIPALAVERVAKLSEELEDSRARGLRLPRAHPPRLRRRRFSASQAARRGLEGLGH